MLSASRFLLFDSSPSLNKTARKLQHAPASVVSEDAAYLALKLDRTAAKLRAEFRRKRSQALVSDLEANFSNGSIGGEHLLGLVEAKASEKVMRSLAKSPPE